ncbi:MAG: hypothetical protein ABIO70_10895 [Pseudomonadota bacterium]
MRAWHVACCASLCTGCLYLGPITLLEEENVPPEIVGKVDGSIFCDEENKDILDVLCVVWLPDRVQKVFVIAQDQNGDPLDFYWWGDSSGPFEDANTFPTGERMASEIEITPEDVIDGEELNCVITDGVPGSQTGWTWNVVVQE